MNRLLYLFLLVTGSTALLTAQVTVTGTVIDDLGDPMIGANVIVRGTVIGTTTDLDGTYEINVPAGSNVLEFSFTGFATVDEAINDRRVIDVQMETDAIGLSEAVVIGYVPVRRKDLVGSVSSIEGDALQDEGGGTVQSALRRAAGVVVSQNSGTPGAGFNIRVRGATSISASNEPLYVVDGVPIISGNFAQGDIGGQGATAVADINPADIESIEVLKDASTTAIYGSRAANGVVLITTKSGARGKTQINARITRGFNEPIKLVDIVDGQGYNEYVQERYGGPSSIFGFDTLVNSNWQELIFDRNSISSYGVNFSGGDSKTTFYASLNHDDNNGIVNNTFFKRYNARLKLNHNITDRVTSAINLSYNNSNNRRVQNDNNIFGAVSAAILLPPAVPVTNEDGSFGSAFGLENPVAATTVYENFLRTNRFIGNGSISYLPLDWLKLTTSLNMDALDINETEFLPDALQQSASGTVAEGRTRNIRLVNEYLATVNTSFADNINFVATLGAIYQNDNIDQLYIVKNNVPTSTPSLSAAAAPATTNGFQTGDVLQSYIASVNFNIAQNLFITGSFRADGSSRFINNQWGYFPGIAAGYDFADFVPGFSQFKLRASFGQTGNNNVGNFTARRLFSGARGYLTNPGTAPAQIGNPDLRWETTTTFDLGLDVTLLENKLSASFGFYNKDTEDLLLNRPLPTTSGFGGVLENIGSMRNTGFEVSVNLIPYNTSEFTWTVQMFAAYNDNEITSLFNDQPIDAGFATRLDVGQPLGSFFGYVTDGIYQNEAEVEAGPSQFGLPVQPGDFRFVDQNGDGVINPDDRTFIGAALPDWTGGITNDFQYLGFDLNLFFQFNLGNEVYNNNLAFAEGLNSVFAPTVRSFEGAWREEGDGDMFPRIGGGVASANNRQDSDRFVEDGSFVRLKTASLGYTIDKETLSGVGLRSVRIFVQGTNLLNWNNYSWFDPEVNTFGGDGGITGAAALGTDFLTYPQARTVEFGINIGL